MKGQIFVGDILTLASTLPFAQAVVTSPPYWGVRHYEIASSIWGGDPNCDHDFAEVVEPPRQRKEAELEHVPKGKKVNGQKFDAQPSHFCVKCGAWRGQLGQEPNPDMYANNLADILTALPLKKDGVMWVNIKDSSIAGKGRSGRSDAQYNAKRRAAGKTISANHANIGGKGKMLPTDNAAYLRQFSLKPKSLALVPARLALAMQARGWLYRSEIIWEKTNGMPESVIDRLPDKTERIMQFTISKHYKFHRHAIKAPVTAETLARYKRGVNENKHNTTPQLQRGIGKPRASRHYHITGNTMHKHRVEGKPEWQGAEYRSLTNVWRMATACHHTEVGVHVAPMPGEIPRRCILLSTDPGDLVLDPFAGTGTTAGVAEVLGRNWAVVDIDERLPDFVAETLAKHKRSPKIQLHGDLPPQKKDLFA